MIKRKRSIKNYKWEEARYDRRKQLSSSYLHENGVGSNSAEDLRVTHTKDSSGGYGFLIYPERHLGKDYSHDAGDVRLNHEVAHFPFQVEVDRHYHIFT